MSAVVLAGQLANPSPTLVRAVAAYKKLGLKGTVKPRKRTIPKRAKHLNDTEIAKLIEGYKAGATVYELADRFAVKRETTSNHLKANGVDLNYRFISPGDLQQMIDLYETGLSVADVAKRVGRHHSGVWRALSKAGVQMRGTHDWRTMQKDRREPLRH